MDTFKQFGYFVVLSLQLVSFAWSQQELKLCENAQVQQVSSLKLSHSGSEDLCVCFIENPAATIETVVDLHLTMSIEEVNSPPSGCFPRLGFRENVDATPLYVCPEADGVTRQSMIRLVGAERAMFQLSNRDFEEFIADVHLQTSPATMLNVRCTVNNQVDSWGSREDDTNFGAQIGGGGQGGQDNDRNDPTVIGVSVAVAIVVIAVIAVIAIIIIMKKRGRASKNEKEMESKTEAGDAENPAFHPDNAPPPQHSAPVQYGNLNINPNPNANNNPMNKQGSMGNLSTASSVSSIGVPDMGAGAIHAAGARQPQQQQQAPPPQQQQPPPPQQQQQPPLQHVPYPQDPVHTQI